MDMLLLAMLMTQLLLLTMKIWSCSTPTRHDHNKRKIWTLSMKTGTIWQARYHTVQKAIVHIVL